MPYNRAAFEADLIRDEGLKLRVYHCTAGKLSIGVGRNLDDVGISPAEQRSLGITISSCIHNGITKAQAMALLDNDIERAEEDLDRYVSWWRALSDVRSRVLLNMCFNMGIGRVGPPAHGLLAFSDMLIAAKNARWPQAADEILHSHYAAQVGDRALRLVAMMRTGVA